MRRLWSTGCFLTVLAARVGALDVTLPEPTLPAPPPMTVRLVALAEPRPTLILVDAMCGGVFEAETPPVPSPAGLIELFGGERAFRSLLAVRRVEVARIRWGANLADSSVISFAEIESVAVTPEDAAALLRVAARDATYHWREFEDESAPVFDVRLKFHTAEEVIFVDLSFDDRVLRVVRGHHQVAEAHFDFGRDEFAGLVDRYFPGALRLKEDF